MGAQLSGAEIAHAIIESDELDRVYPKPAAADLDRLRPGTRDVSSLNLAALWATYRALGHRRLIMSGVMLHLDFDRRWILQAIPDAAIKVIRLVAGEASLRARIEHREIGSGADAQMERSLRQAQRMASEKPDGLMIVQTDGRSPAELAKAVLEMVEWSPVRS